MRTLYESITQSRFTRREIDESILDSDITIAKDAEIKALSLQLYEHGIYYACTNTNTKVKLAYDNEIMYFNNGVLSFYNDDVNVSSQVVIWYDKAKDFLKKIGVKTIEAPRITIIYPDDDMSAFGVLKTKVLVLYQPNTNHIKNLAVESGRESDCMIVKNINSRPDRDGVGFNSIQSKENPNTESYIKVNGFDHLTFHNCKLDVNNLSISGDGVDFKNCTGDLVNIEVYDPGLFDGECGKELFKIFDDKYEFYCWRDKGGQRQEIRKTNSMRKTLAFFGNKQYYCPDKVPFRVIKPLKDVCDLSGFKNIYVLNYRDNTYTVAFTPNNEKAERCRSIDKFKYMSNTHQTHAIPRTPDGYYCVIFSNK